MINFTFLYDDYIFVAANLTSITLLDSWWKQKVEIIAAESMTVSKLLFFSFHAFFLLAKKHWHLPTMQLDYWQFSQRFRCVILVAATVALSTEEEVW